MKIRIGHLYPDLLNLYGDRGNIACLRQRLLWRGIDAQVTEYQLDDRIDFEDLDIVLLGGGSDREQMLVCEKLREKQADMKAFTNDGGTVIAVCGGYQLLGHYYDTSEGRIAGLGLVDLYTVQGSPRLISNVVLESDRYDMKITGFENHGGRTHTGDLPPFGKVLFGYGNNGEDGREGVVWKNVIGTYLHGPLLPKNPMVADDLLIRAMDRKYGIRELEELDDSWEREANQYIVERFTAGHTARSAV